MEEDEGVKRREKREKGNRKGRMRSETEKEGEGSKIIE
jgi:hypothetical protein